MNTTKEFPKKARCKSSSTTLDRGEVVKKKTKKGLLSFTGKRPETEYSARETTVMEQQATTSSDASSGRTRQQYLPKHKKLLEDLLDPKSINQKLSPEVTRSFVNVVTTYGPRDLLKKLVAPDSIGPKRIYDLYTFCDSYDNYKVYFAPLLQSMFHDSLDAPIFKSRRDTLMLGFYHEHFFTDTIIGIFVHPDTQMIIGSVESAHLEDLCKLLTLFSRSVLEARSSEDIRVLAKALRAEGIKGSEDLCNTIMNLVEKSEKRAPAAVSSSLVEPAWYAQQHPAGGRHDNDHLNYRDISIVPTAQEVACTDTSYLPLANRRNRTEGLSDESYLLDSQFRLLREDLLHPLRQSFVTRRSFQHFKDARPIAIHLPDKKSYGESACIIFRFELSGNFKRKNMSDFWESFRGFQTDSLVSFTRGDDPNNPRIVRFGTVATSKTNKDWLLHPLGPRVGVTFDRDEDLRDVLSELGRPDAEPYGIAPASISFFAYKPVLHCLQNMTSVPMREIIVDGSRSEVRPSVLPRFVKLPDDFNSVQLDLDAGEDGTTDANSDLSKNTSLDASQRESLYMALTEQVALVQGPPGTGKTFLGSLIARTILRNSKAKILCVCYTNHALDQFLEYILDKEPSTKIARIGGSTKVSERMVPYTLQELARVTVDNASRDAKHAMWELREKLEKVTATVKKIQERLLSPLLWDDAETYLKNFDFKIYEQLATDSVDDEEFKMVGQDGKEMKRDYLWKKWCNGEGKRVDLSSSMSRQLSIQPLNETVPTPQVEIWSIEPVERVRMISSWHSEIFEEDRERLALCFRSYLHLKKQLSTVLDERKREVLSSAVVIGATTSGAAKFHELIKYAAADVVVVEEAGEILECHVLTSLSSSTKQLILIGDHLQLRPKLECYDLTVVSGKGYNLDVSLFERLVLGGLAPSRSLNVQHRMRREISQIIRFMTYPMLEDHISTFTRPNIVGIGRDIAFIDHQTMERGCGTILKETSMPDKSKVNDFEVKYCVELVRHILFQNYKQNQVVVLTPYLGQLKEIRSHMKIHLKEVNCLISDLDREELCREGLGEDQDAKDMKERPQQGGVRVSTVDNYQGEECDIVIISLVRSNTTGDIGFLKEPQRVNVMLSRARNGMYIVGNSQTFLASKKGHATWAPIIEYLKSLDSFLTTGLPTFCQKHPRDTFMLSDPENFRRHRPNGGCSLKCQQRMLCGHSCPLQCHVIDEQHVGIKCFEKCPRFPEGCPHEHLCPKLCHEQCGDCCTLIDVVLPCSHKARVPCHLTTTSIKIGNINCREDILFTIAECNHQIVLQCYETRSGKIPLCTLRCGATLADCSHPCPGTCGQCRINNCHSKCNKTCERILSCGHRCDRPCHMGSDCQSCEKKCAIRCRHSNCPKNCCLPCSPCIERCDWMCEHRGRCPLPCAAPCSRLPCDMRCNLILECGHQCPGICGEECPSNIYCHVCGTMGRQMIDLIMMQSYKDVDVTTDPVIFLQCGHFYPKSFMDGYMELDETYRKVEVVDGGNSQTSSGISYDRPRSCPECRTVITSVFRYGRPVKHVELIFLERKHASTIMRDLEDSRGKPAVQRETVLLNILEKVKLGPKRKVYEAAKRASESFHLVDCPLPSPDRLLKTHKALVDCYLELIQDIVNDKPTEDTVDKAIKSRKELCRKGLLHAGEGLALSIETSSIKSAVDFKLLLASLYETLGDTFSLSEVARLCNDVINDPDTAVTTAQRDTAILLRKRSGKLSQWERNQIRAAMSGPIPEGGNGIIGHWYECSKGHEYYIGNCGQANQVSKCNECGEVIGGTGHMLVGTSRPSSRMLL